ncbi:hypothetical protein DAI22_06g196903 [Oryza sativa Japonica Group]|nr:hypothetical protein DAI22_06g196903 [Oryza sativa Japonica Group]
MKCRAFLCSQGSGRCSACSPPEALLRVSQGKKCSLLGFGDQFCWFSVLMQ